MKHHDKEITTRKAKNIQEENPGKIKHEKEMQEKICNSKRSVKDRDALGCIWSCICGKEARKKIQDLR